MEDKNGRSALSQGTVGTPTKVKATLASIPVATKSLVQHGISSMSLHMMSFTSAVYFVNGCCCRMHLGAITGQPGNGIIVCRV